jgi:nucleoside-diphosphate-sugar epimerase
VTDGGSTVLVTGASGLVGGEIVALLESLGHEVITVGRSPLDRTQHLVIDLAEDDLTARLPSRMDGIVHCAAEVYEAGEGFGVVDRNLRLTWAVAEFARQAKPAIFVNVSSIAVYGQRSGVRTESDEACPDSAYGAAKLLGEALLAARVRGPVAHLRLGYVLGRPLPERYLVRRLSEAISRGDRIDLWHADATRFAFVDARDVAVACDILLRDPVGGTFNLVADERPTLRQLVAMLAAVHGAVPRIVENGPRGEPMSMEVSNLRAKSVLGFVPTPVRETLSRVSS